MAEKFALCRFRNKLVLLTPSRRNRIEEPIPEELYCYELRCSDEGFEACQLAKSIFVNFYGTVFSKEKIDLSDQGYVNFEEDEMLEYLDEIVTFDEYMQKFLTQKDDITMTL